MTQIIPLKLSVSNAYLIKAKRTILVDTGSPNEGDKILELAAKHGVLPDDIALILLTHGHMDHAGSAAELKQRLGVPVAIHSADSDMLTSGKNRPFQTIGLEAKLVNLFLSSTFPPLQHDLLLDASFDLSAYGIAGQIVHTPGHTAGSISIVLEDGQAIVGDIVRGGYMGGSLLPNKPLHHYFAESFEQIDSSLRSLFTHTLTTLSVGHGGPLSATHVQQAFQLHATR